MIESVKFHFRKLSIPVEAEEFAKEKNFEIKGYVFDAKAEDIRPQRLVRIGAIQNQIVESTSASITAQVSIKIHKFRSI